MRTLIDAIQDGIVIVDHRSRITFVNKGAETIFGHDAQAMIGQSLNMLLPEPVRERHQDYITSFLDEDRSGRMMAERAELSGLRADGTEFPAEISICRFDLNGAPRLGAIVRDVSARRAREAALEEALDQAKAAKEAQASFLAKMSHEIRTPLNGILGMAELLESGLNDSGKRHMAQVIRQSGVGMLNLLNDLLDMSKIEAGKLSLERAPVCATELAHRLEEIHAIAAEEKGLSMEVFLGSGCDLPRMGDALRIQQILHNLLSNAVKFTESGGVTLTISGRADQPLQIVVTDTGIGMTEDQVQRLYDDYVQADSTISRRFGGSGLGMSIVRQLTETMGGSIDVHSVIGAGTRIAISLPLEMAPAENSEQATAQAPEQTFEDRRVLVADDNQTNRELMTAMLTRLGITPVVVNDGLEAVNAAQEQDFDLILMDISMPVMDGITALKEICASRDSANLPEVPIVAVTANAMPHQVTEYIVTGFATYLAKPFELADLRRVLTEL
ncbi:MAG: response regulator [Sediminimonas qiaohouensis]|uniref:histidine kinase n=1 Tax=Sediminimonas qiaohouensis TaxID=552061 RepID=A0A7C9LMZ3_9RHOB|nr:ATP-binding protein [Sediminimonas qiaohouensis]MTJ04240.1 response regulator [Sediminimonas qiaohouensis]